MSAVERHVDWHAAAACRGRTPLFFAGDAFSERVAVALCRRCPVLGQCAAETARDEVCIHEIYGTRAAFTAGQRRAVYARARSSSSFQEARGSR